MTELSLSDIAASLVMVLFTLIIYQAFAWLQKKFNQAWLNPMLLAIAVIIPLMLYLEISFEHYYSATLPLSQLLEPAVVALGFPLYQHLKTIRQQAKFIIPILALGTMIVILLSFAMTVFLIAIPEIAVSLSLKSVTTPIGIALTEQLKGDTSITAFAIILAGLFGGLLGPSWLHFIGVDSPKAQSLAIGAASHALGTASVSKISHQHAAYSSLALILSAVLTAILSPSLIIMLTNFLTNI